VMSKFELRLTAKLPGLAPPMRKPLALRDRDQRAGKRQTLRNEHQGLNPPVGRQRAQSRRQRDRPAAGKKALLAVIEADDLMDAFDAHIERATVLRDRFRVIPPARRQRSPVGTQDRRHFGVRDAARPRALVDDAAAKPPTLVAQGDEMRAIRRNANGRNATEVLVGRTQHETAAEFEQPELPAGGVANVEGRDRLAANLDRDRRRGGRRDLRIGRHDRQEQRTCDERRDGPSVCPCETATQTRRAVAHASSLRGRRGSAWDCSSNSSASFSVMAPPSSSASTIVTARR